MENNVNEYYKQILLNCNQLLLRSSEITEKKDVDEILIQANLLVSSLAEIQHFYIEIESDLDNFCYAFLNYFNSIKIQKRNLYQCDIIQDGNVGRPKFSVSQEKVELLRSIGLSWMEIARLVGVSIRTLTNKRAEFVNFIDHDYNELPMQDLEDIVREILTLSPNSGEVMLMGFLRSRGIKIQRWKLRRILWSLNPITKKRSCIRRRVYSVPHPNALWHIDGHHKLIRWRIVIHGGIDGFSRSVVYLRASSNNYSSTVSELFDEAVQKFSWPIRVRSDHGMENIGVARTMLEKYGIECRPFITGKSVHNQRIERLWKDVNTYVVSLYKKLFYWMEDMYLLDISNDKHLFALEYIFLPRINSSLKNFSSQWNNHKLRTAGYKSPVQIWCMGLSDTVIHYENNIDAYYGIDDDGPIPELQTDNNVQIPTVNFVMSHEQKNEILSLNPFSDDGNFGITLYNTVLNIIS